MARDDSWPLVLTSLLATRHLPLATPRVIATTGWTTDELMAAVKADKADKADNYDLVTLLIGVNDQYRGRPVEQYRTGLIALLQYAIGRTRTRRSGRSPPAGHVSARRERPDRSGQNVGSGAASRVIVVSIPDWSRTPFAEGRDRAAIVREIQSYNAVAAEEAARAGCRWADIRAVQDADGDADTLLVADRLHPSAEAYEAWARAILPFALAALGRA